MGVKAVGAAEDKVEEMKGVEVGRVVVGVPNVAIISMALAVLGVLDLGAVAATADLHCSLCTHTVYTLRLRGYSAYYVTPTTTTKTSHKNRRTTTRSHFLYTLTRHA